MPFNDGQAFVCQRCYHAGRFAEFFYRLMNRTEQTCRGVDIRIHRLQGLVSEYLCQF